MELYTQCTDVTLLVWILCSPHLSCHHGGDCVKGTWDLSMLSCNFLCIYNHFKIKSSFFVFFFILGVEKGNSNANREKGNDVKDRANNGLVSN